ncbi:MAG TPA: hypothetical protein K8V56_13045 [Sporosarcina psychrophila]|uniref:DUF3221 domain-containing protein n=1 Tax=Sporosarcina psychrophila TaxID=1476 RepID=A0A921KF06_SPOPS|nr:hypothetical protein [Sporosarcina psychrophila]
MKNKIILLCFIVTNGLLFACNSEKAENPKNEIKTTFVGTIEEVHGKTATVVVSDSANSELAGRTFEVGLSVYPNETFQAGDKVRVEYDEVMEIAPPVVNALKIEKMK